MDFFGGCSVVVSEGMKADSLSLLFLSKDERITNAGLLNHNILNTTTWVRVIQILPIVLENCSKEMREKKKPIHASIISNLGSVVQI